MAPFMDVGLSAGISSPVSTNVFIASRIHNQPMRTLDHVSGLLNRLPCTRSSCVNPSAAADRFHSTRLAGSSLIAAS